MTELFLQIFNMSISAGWLILAVIVLRYILSKANAPKGIHYVLWALVAIRLVCPISIESAFSFMPSGEVVSTDVLSGEDFEINSGIPMVDEAVNTVLSEQSNADSDMVTSSDKYAESNEDEVGRTEENDRNSVQNLIYVASIIWGLGIIGLLVYTLISYLRLRRTIGASLHLRDELWICDEVGSPFILGLRQPHIYIPSYIQEEQIPYIVAHEKEHLRYHDNWWKPIGFGILTLHWFNPLVWAAYILMCKDIELACDERVIRTMDNVKKKQYGESLLLCSSPRHLISACPVAFGEVGIKERILRVLNYKKPAFWVVGIAVVLCIIVAIGFMTNPLGKEEDNTEDVIYETESEIIESEIVEDETENDESENPFYFAMQDTWQGFIKDIEGTGENDIAWFTEESSSDFSKWFTEYEGQNLQRVEGCENGCDGNCSVSACCDTIYYKAQQGESLQSVLYKMIEAMITSRMTDSADRTYTITEYEIMEQDLVQVSEHMWILPFVEGYYAFEGVDVNTMEDSYPKKDDLVRFQNKVSNSGFWYVLVEEDGVYRLQNYHKMLLEN